MIGMVVVAVVIECAREKKFYENCKKYFANELINVTS
jgi:hypothetical protein